MKHVIGLTALVLLFSIGTNALATTKGNPDGKRPDIKDGKGKALEEVLQRTR